MKKIKDIVLSNDPEIHARSVLFFDDKNEIQRKNKKQFITTKEATLTVIFEDDSTLELYAPKNYKFDGATIPCGIGKGNMKLQIPSLFHDILCDTHSLVNYDRKLADTIFKECLIKCGVNKIVAQWMYINVELYQKFFCDWSKDG